MSSNLDKFDTITEDHEIVEVGGEVYLKYERRGSCLVYLLLPNSSINQILLKNILFVPDLGHYLISWNVLGIWFYCEMYIEHVYIRQCHGHKGMNYITRLWVSDKGNTRQFMNYVTHL